MVKNMNEKIYYVAYNELDKQIYFGNCGPKSTFVQNLRCSLKIKGKELHKWSFYSIINLHDDIETPEDKEIVLQRFYTELFKTEICLNGNSFKIMNKQPEIIREIFNYLKNDLSAEAKLMLTIYKELA